MKIMFYDIETTGLFASNCGIHQISGAITELKPGDKRATVLDHFNFKMKPFQGKRVYPSALEVGGLTYDTIAAYPEPKAVYNQFIEIIKKHVNKFDPDDKMFLAGYNNLHFDNDFLRQWFCDCGDRYFGSYFWSNAMDVMAEAGKVLMNIRPFMPNFKLGTVAKTFGIKFDEGDLHDAMVDIRLTIQIFNKILENPSIRNLDGLNLGKMKEEVLAHKEEQRRENKHKKEQERYVVFE